MKLTLLAISWSFPHFLFVLDIQARYFQYLTIRAVLLLTEVITISVAPYPYSFRKLVSCQVLDLFTILWVLNASLSIDLRDTLTLPNSFWKLFKNYRLQEELWVLLLILGYKWLNKTKKLKQFPWYQALFVDPKPV